MSSTIIPSRKPISKNAYRQDELAEYIETLEDQLLTLERGRYKYVDGLGAVYMFFALAIITGIMVVISIIIADFDGTARQLALVSTGSFTVWILVILRMKSYKRKIEQLTKDLRLYRTLIIVLKRDAD